MQCERSVIYHHHEEFLCFSPLSTKNFHMWATSSCFKISLSLSLSCFFLELHLWHMEVLRLGIELEMQLQAYATGTATQDPSHICDLHHCSQQYQILKPLSKARSQTHILMDPSQACNPLSHYGNSL